MSKASQQSKIFPLSDFLEAKIDVERRDDGTLVLRSPEPLGDYERCPLVSTHLF